MRKHLACAAALALGGLLAAPVNGEGFPASKHAVAYGAPVVLSESSDWQPILAQKIKTANAKGLGMHVSLECGLYTRQLVRSKGLARSEAKASVKVRVLVDGVEVADPGEVTFCSRSAKSSAVFAGIFAKIEDSGSCFFLEGVDTDGDGVNDHNLVKIEENCLQAEELELLEDSMSAHSYYFYYDDTSPGEHLVTVEALIDEATGAEGTDTLAGDQGAKATLGSGSLLIEEIRLIHGANGDTLEF